MQEMRVLRAYKKGEHLISWFDRSPETAGINIGRGYLADSTYLLVHTSKEPRRRRLFSRIFIGRMLQSPPPAGDDGAVQLSLMRVFRVGSATESIGWPSSEFPEIQARADPNFVGYLF